MTELTSGMLTVHALLSLPQKKFAYEKDRFDYVFNLMDSNGSGYLEEAELLAFVRVVRRLGGVLPDDEAQMGAQARWGRWLVGAGWMYPPASAKGLVLRWMAQCDENHDGKISREEFTALGRRIQLQKVVEVWEGALEASV